ncbi:alpha/beta hydrolase [Cytobacillus sp. FJAT-54145]|uniref:Alpha/beta hydrolase n=1 Tax=Cytobacillus spartinae TaxID=3299023 RepID=A0ABW6K771_9BACI
MSLHPQAKALLQMFEARNAPSLEEVSLQEARGMFEQSAKLLNKAEDIFHVEDRKIQGYQREMKVRIYTPSDNDRLPVLVYFHGGGWVIGNLETHDSLCRSLANQSNCKVVSVDYGLAPENKFPVAVEDAYLATKWVSEHADELNVDKNNIAVGGDSAGGNLAAVVCYLANERKGPSISQQLLFYPSTGFEYTESYEKYGEGYYLTKSQMKWFREQYLNDETDTLNPLAAPMLLSDEDTALLPTAYIVTAEFDPLCDGGENYSRKLTNAGVQTTYICYPGMIHGFISMAGVLDDGKKAITEAALYLKEQFANKVK